MVPCRAEKISNRFQIRALQSGSLASFLTIYANSRHIKELIVTSGPGECVIGISLNFRAVQQFKHTMFKFFHPHFQFGCQVLLQTLLKFNIIVLTSSSASSSLEHSLTIGRFCSVKYLNETYSYVMRTGASGPVIRNTILMR